MSYFDTTVFNRTAQQQKETNDLLRELIKTLQEQKSKGRYPTQNFEPPMPTQPSPTAQAADSVPAGESEQERIAFKDAHRHLDLDEVPDAWGRPMFKHSHVEASWLGWVARASHGQAPAQTTDSQLLKFYGVTTDAELIAAQAAHIEKLQARPTKTPSFAPQRVREG